MKLHQTKRILSLILTLAMLASLWVPMSVSLAAEVQNSASVRASNAQAHWAAKDLDEWSAKGWLNGNEAGDYMPDAQVSRAQFMAFVNRAMGYTAPSDAVAGYADVRSDAWYRNDVAIALGAGYIQGTNGMMRPEAAISRQEAVVILARLAGYEAAPVDVGYLELALDAEAIPAWAKSAASVAVREGFIAGIDGKFEGGRSITRAESVVLLNRFVTGTRVFGFAGIYGGTAAAPMKMETAVIAAEGITLEHAVVASNVEVAVGVGEGDATLRDVVVKGQMNINGGGRNSVYLIRVTIGDTLEIRKPDVRVVIVDETDIETVKLYANAILDASGAEGAAIYVEIIEVPESETGDNSEDNGKGKSQGVTLIGDFVSVTNTAPGLDLTIEGHVDTLVLDAGATVTGAADIGTAMISEEAGKDTIFDKAPSQMTGDGQKDATILEKNTGGSTGNGYTPNPAPTAGTITMGDLSAMSVTAGGSDSVTVTATASNGNAVTVAAVSSATSVATVGVTGKTVTVNAVMVGTATITITASAANCPDVVKTFVVTVSTAAPESGTITVADLSAMSVTAGGSDSVTVTAAASNGNTVSIAAASGAAAVATVSVAGKTITVNGVASGTAIITVTASAANCPDVVKTFSVNVAPAAGTITMENLVAIGANVGDNAEVNVTATASNGQTVTIAAVSGTPAVATVAVDEKQITVTAVAAGTATITVTASAAYCPDVVKTFVVTVSVFVPATDFTLFDADHPVPKIYVAADDYKQIVRATGDLRDDIERVTGHVPVVQNTTEGLGNRAIIVGSLDSQVIQDMIAAGKLNEAEDLTDESGAPLWESYLIKIVNNPVAGVAQALVIVGSDKRGAVYGIYDLSEQLGVSPWYFWGDIIPEVQDEIIIDTPLKFQGEPSVKYRGIFINDEQNMAYWATYFDKTESIAAHPDWGVGNNIDTHIYVKVFELLLRLKANYLWPGMHSEPRLGPDSGENSLGTMGAIDHFNKFPSNREQADRYGIVVGTSHCEPMMRNGTAEYAPYVIEYDGNGDGTPDYNLVYNSSPLVFDEYPRKVETLNNGDLSSSTKWLSSVGMPKYDYSYTQNRGVINDYWADSVKDYTNSEVSYTLGMRGLHDAGFQHANASSTAAQKDLLQAVVDAQIEMMAEHQTNEEAFPIFIPYKEVLTLYEAGLELPPETIIVWAEDNHGHIRRFPTAEENAKYAGSGVYYHMNYEGTGSYSWLTGISNNLMVSEMNKAYDAGAQALWVLNVGDLKPTEVSMELFLEMAYDITRWNGENLDSIDADDDGVSENKGFYEQLSEKWFPDVNAADTAYLLENYFRLTGILMPDHTTGSTGGSRYGFDQVHYGDELTQRAAEYQDLAEKAQAIFTYLKDDLGDTAQADAFYQHVAYPIIGASFNMQKYYHSQKNSLYMEQGRTAAANVHAAMVDWAHDQEAVAITYYNKTMSGGKWDWIMRSSNKTRGNRSPKPSAATVTNISYMSKMGVLTEKETAISENSVLNFSVYLEDTHFVDVFNLGSKGFEYTAAADKGWVIVSEPGGTVYDDIRLFVSIDWSTLPAGDQSAILTITGANGETKEIAVNVSNPAGGRGARQNMYVEANGYVAVEAEHFNTNVKKDGIGFTNFVNLGRSGDAISAGPMGSASYAGTTLTETAPYVTYDVYLETAGTYPVTIYRIPTLESAGQRFAVGVGAAVPTVIEGTNIVHTPGGDPHGSSTKWTRNVINGIEKLVTNLTFTAGVNTVRLYMVDAGVAIDRIIIGTTDPVATPDTSSHVGHRPNMGPPESYHSVYNPNPVNSNSGIGSDLVLVSMREDFLEAYITGSYAALVDAKDGAVKAMLESELAAVRTILEGTIGDDTVRRAYSRLVSAAASVEAMENIDTLLTRAIAQGATILLNGGSGIKVYLPAAVEAFETAYTPIAAEAAQGGLNLQQKLDVYERLMVAMNTVEASRVVTATASASEGENPATNAIDGDPSTRWAGTSGYPKTVEVNLGDVYSLDEIAITWFNSNANDHTVLSGNRAYQYKISVSTDGSLFTELVDRSTNRATNTVTEDLRSSSISGQYVRVEVLGGANGGSGGPGTTGSASIWEIQIAGTKPEPATQAEMDALAAAIATAKAVDGSELTIDSYAPLAKLIVLGEAIVAAENPMQSSAVSTTAEITAALDALKNRAEVFTDTFENTTIEALKAAGWTFTENDGTVTLEGDAGNQYLKVHQPTTSESIIYRELDQPIEGKVYVEVTFRSGNSAVNFVAPFLYQSAADAAGNTSPLTGMQWRPGGNIETSNGVGTSTTRAKIGDYVQDEWYTVTYVIDSTSDRLQVYIGNTLGTTSTQTDFPRRYSGNLGAIRFHAGGHATNGAAIGYIDNLRVYTEELPPPPDTLPDDIAQAEAELTSAIAAAETEAAKTDTYTIDSYAALVTALAAGETELANEHTTLLHLENITASTTTLNTAVAALKERGAYIVNDDFSGYENLDDVLNGTGWELLSAVGVGSVTFWTDDPEVGNYLRFAQNALGETVGLKHTLTPTSGKIYIEVTVRSDTPRSAVMLPFLHSPNMADSIASMQFREGTAAAGKINISTSGTTTTNAASFNAGEWYTLTLVIDTTKATNTAGGLQAYLGTEQIRTDGVLRTGLKNLGVLRFYSDQKIEENRDPAIGYVASLRIYQEATP